MNDTRNLVDELGPHAGDISVGIETFGEFSRMRISAGVEGHFDVRTDHETRIALELATALGITNPWIARAVDQKLRDLDQESRFEEMATVVGHLIKVPAWGIRQGPNNEGKYQPARTWRLEKVNPKLAREWQEKAELHIQNTGND